jgi:hypothetical protein
MSLIQLYKDITLINLRSGQETSFWLDNLLGNKPLSIQYRALFSHVRNPNVTIAEVHIEIGWNLRSQHITS